MIKFFTIFFIILNYIFAEDFISKSEYAKMLYKNPRGIGCNHCHGDLGEGKTIAKYKSYDKKTKQLQNHSLIAPQINNIELEKFSSSLKKSKGMMPSYFLTDSEILTLYEYLQAFEKQGSKNE